MRVAPLFRSVPRSAIPQPDYLNTAILGDAALAAEDLLAITKELERRAGRTRGPRGAPRPLDIDLLLWGDRVQIAPELTLPHPRLRERAFVLTPLARIAPDLIVPPAGPSVAELLARLAPPATEVVEIGWAAAGAPEGPLDRRA